LPVPAARVIIPFELTVKVALMWQRVSKLISHKTVDDDDDDDGDGYGDYW